MKHHGPIALTTRVEMLSERKRALLAELRAERAVRPQPEGALQWLRPGAGRSAVLVHPIGGNIFSYVDLVASLPRATAVLAIAADHMLAAASAPLMSELAAHYLDELRASHVCPAVLAGWSYGGVVCYEMARLSAEAGEPLNVVLIDSAPTEPSLVPFDRDLIDITRSFVYHLLRSGGASAADIDLDPADDVWDLPTNEALAGISAAIAGRGYNIGLSAAELLARHRVYVNAVRSLDTYRVPPLAEPVHLVRALRGDEDLPALWGAASALTITELDADHYDIIRRPRVAEVARIIEHASGEGGQAPPGPASRAHDDPGPTQDVRGGAWRGKPGPPSADP